jgi:uncharacterized membrane protein
MMLHNFLRLWRRKPAAAPRMPAWLWLAAAALAALLAAAALLKYRLFGYNALDLAIFNQVFWLTAHGVPFGLTIHPPSFLGDHAGLVILLLTPLYWLWQDPRALLVMQAVALAAPAPLLYVFIRRRAAALQVDAAWASRAAALLAAAWLASPLVHNIGLFEFHLLPFALAPLFAAALAFEAKNRRLWILAAALALIVREDIGLIVMMFSLLAWLEGRSLWWRLVPFLTGAGWFLAASTVIRLMNPAGAYKYAVYYEWLGPTPFHAALAVFTRPLAVLGHLLTLANLEMLIALLMPLAFLPALGGRRGLRYWWLALVPLAQILLGAPGGSAAVTQMHYAAFFLPALFLSAAEAALQLPERAWFRRAAALAMTGPRAFLAAVVVVTLAYAVVVQGPWLGVAQKAADRTTWEHASAARAAVAAVADDAAVAASYSLLPALSGRANVYALHYLYLGVQQFGVSEYPAPDELAYLAVEQDDLLAYEAQFPQTAWAATHHPEGRDRLRLLLGDAIYNDGAFTVYERRRTLPPSWVEGAGDQNPILFAAEQHYGDERLDIDARWSRPADARRFAVRIILEDTAGNEVREQTQPLLALPPLTQEDGYGITTHHRLPLAGLPPGGYRARLELVRQTAAMVLDGWRSTERRVAEESVPVMRRLDEFMR